MRVREWHLFGERNEKGRQCSLSTPLCAMPGPTEAAGSGFVKFPDKSFFDNKKSVLGVYGIMGGNL